MVDPFTLSASAGGIVSLGLTVVQGLIRYYGSCESWEKDVKDAFDRLERLAQLFELTRNLVGSKPPTDDSRIQVENCVLACEHGVAELNKKLQKIKKSDTGARWFSVLFKDQSRRLFYPFKEGTIKKIRLTVIELCENLNLALSIMQIQVSDQQLVKLDNILQSGQERESSIQVLADNTTQTADSVQGLISKVDSVKLSDDLRKYKLWLGAPDSSINHNVAQNKALPNTGLWLSSASDFEDWYQVPGAFFWLFGFAGCGKTVLCSKIIDHFVEQSRGNRDIAIAYYYFDFTDPEKQRVDGFIRSIVSQIYSSSMMSLTGLEQLYVDCFRGQRMPTLNQLVSLLIRLLPDFTRVYIFVDAMDECLKQEREQLFGYFRDIRRLSSDKVNILMTSRNEYEIAESIRSNITHELELKDQANADIQTAVVATVRTDPRFRKWPEDVKRMVETSLVEKADGNFRWVDCQFSELRNCLTLEQVEFILDNLPRTLNEVYDRILTSMVRLHDKIAIRILQWLCYSVRPLDIKEVAEIAALDPDSSPTYSPKRRLMDVEDVLRICGSFIEVSKTDKRVWPWSHTQEIAEVKFAHASVKDFLTSHRHSLAAAFEETASHGYIVRSCLAHLTYINESYPNWPEILHSFPLLQYAVREWPAHVCILEQLVEDEPMPWVESVLEFMDQRNQSWLNWEYMFCNKHHLETVPIHYASFFGFSHVMNSLLKQGYDINEQYSYKYFSPNYISDWGDVRRGNILEVAALQGNTLTVRVLLNQGADVEAEYDEAARRFRVSPIASAAARGHTSCLDLLLNHGIKVKSENLFHPESYNWALYEAVKNSQLQTTKLLLQRNSKFSLKDEGKNLLPKAVELTGKVGSDISQLLLDFGADPDAEVQIYFPSGNSFTGNTLFLVIHDGFANLSNVNFLLKNGAKINAMAGNVSKGEVLPAAVANSSYDVVKLLIDQNADLNTLCPIYGTALQAAVARAQFDILELIIHRGAVRGFDKALKTTVRTGNTREIGKLLRANLPESYQEYAPGLNMAISTNRLDIAEWIIRAGADLHDRCLGLSTCLQAAVKSLDAVKLLLENGADVNFKGGDYATALQAAARFGDIKVVRFLILQGAKVNETGGGFHSALQAAAARKRIEHRLEIVNMLLEFGSEVNMCGGIYGTALNAAIRSKSTELVKLLLRSGALVDLPSQPLPSLVHIVEGRAPLMSGTMEKEMIELILEAGGKVAPNYILSLAIRMGHSLTTARALVEAGAAVDAKLPNGTTPLIATAVRDEQYYTSENLELITYLLEHGSNPNIICEIYGTALIYAAAHRRTDLVRLLLAHGAAADQTVPGFGKAVYAAARPKGSPDRPSWDILRLLLREGANDNVWDICLILAACKGDEEMCRFHMRHGVETDRVVVNNATLKTIWPEAQNYPDGAPIGTALQVAAFCAQAKIVEMLVEQGANVNAPPGVYGSALAAAIIGFAVDERIRSSRLGIRMSDGDMNERHSEAQPTSSRSGLTRAGLIDLLLNSGAEVRTPIGEVIVRYGTVPETSPAFENAVLAARWAEFPQAEEMMEGYLEE